MALIEHSKGRAEGGGYERLFGDKQLGHLLSRIQATVITTGSELEKIIISLADKIDNVNEFLANQTLDKGTYLVSKTSIKHSLLSSNLEPDLLIFKIDQHRQHCYIVELKDGDNFDTKKAQGERKLLEEFQNHISSKIRFTTSIHICCFNQLDKKKIVAGFKKKITEEMAMTGEELCNILNINYAEILGSRKYQQQQNLAYFINELVKIETVRVLLEKKLQETSSI